MLLVSSRIFEKRRASCFTNPDLKDFLEGNGAKSIEFIGVDGNGCVKASVLAAVKENYQVSVDLSAVGVCQLRRDFKIRCLSGIYRSRSRRRIIIAKKKTTFICQNCAYNSPKYLGRCPNCGSWSSFVEEVEVAEVKNARVSLTGEKTKPMKLADVTSINVHRTKTEMEEFNRVLGGGVVPGSLVLIGGDPGIGKSTLLLQVSTQLSQVGTVLYVSGEESAQQIKLRAERLGDIDSEFYLYAETNMQSVRAEVERIQPDFLIIDSIQTIMSPEISGVQGSVSQVREVTAELMQLAKTNNIAIFIVGHVTKEGTLAGPRMLEHMVDTVLYFEGNAIIPSGS